jgi:hypothetical protein
MALGGGTIGVVAMEGLDTMAAGVIGDHVVMAVLVDLMALVAVLVVVLVVVLVEV